MNIKHDPNWIKSTTWAKQLPSEKLCNKIIELLEEADFKVSLYSNNETGEKLVTIITENFVEFWIDSFKTKREAVSLCKQMGWIITQEY